MRLGPGVIELQRFPFLFSICTRNFDVRRECQVSLESWQPVDSEYAFQFALQGLVPELLGFKDFLFLWLFLQNINSKEVVACFLEGQSIPQRKYRKVKGAFIKRSQFVFLSFIRLSVFLILNSLQQPSFSLPLPFFFLSLSIYRQSKIFGQHTQGEWETITGTALMLPCTTFKHVLDCLVFMVRIKWTLWGCFTFTIILMVKIYQFLWWK